MKEMWNFSHQTLVDVSCKKTLKSKTFHVGSTKFIYIYITVYEVNIYFALKNKRLYAAVDMIMMNHDEFKLGVGA